MNMLRVVPTCVLLAGLLAVSAQGADRIRVVTTTTDLKALTEAVGGGLVEVDALARGNQNPHDLEVRPSLMVKVRRADVLVLNGLELDQWADVVVQGANNPKVIPGAPGRVDASAGILVLEVPTTRVDRSMGDVHPVGNPHYSLDPGLAPAVTANILEGLVRVAPEYRAMFERNRAEFLGRLEAALRGWSATLAPFKGAPVVVYHAQWAYLLARFGLTQVGTVEERPGIPPAPGHVAKLIQLMKDEKVKVVIVEPWSDYKLAERVAQEAGGQVVLLATGVGAVKGAETYLDAVDYNVKTLAKALK
ncbi:MAG TPA: metal ABC transporter substrate-binding protein [Candidatus Udaeobacter sp.]|nr:metal ABC transporter substrate-binding protein [Candidatus Udaeobacter sp.]